MDGTDVGTNLSCNTLLVEIVVLNTPSIGQSRRVEDVNLRKRSRVLIVPTDFVTHRYAVSTYKPVNIGLVGLTLTARTTLLVHVSKGFGLIEINVSAGKDVVEVF